MNGIVRVTNKPANIIDTLRSDLAKEARRLADVLRWPPPSWETLAKNVAGAELMLVAPEYQSLAGVLRATFAPASVEDITRELGLVFGCYPARDIDVSVLVACAVDEVIREEPSVLSLLLSVRRIRRTCKFRPSIAEIVEALDEVEDESAMSWAREILELPKRLDVAASLLCNIVGSAIKGVEQLLIDRERERQRRWGVVEEIDEQLSKTRRLLEAMSAHRPKALEAQRLLITQSISITENEKVTVLGRGCVRATGEGRCKNRAPNAGNAGLGETTEVGWGEIVSRILALSLVTLLGALCWYARSGIDTGTLALALSRRRITISAIRPARKATENGVGNLNGR
jgi:hypothetical protein